VLDGEGDESDVKTKEKSFGKQNRKEDEPCGKENENKDKQRKRWKQQWKDKIRVLKLIFKTR